MIIKLIKRARLKKRPSNIMPFYDICIVHKASHRKNVVEKIGSYNTAVARLELNVFRLIYWISKDVGITGNSVEVLCSAGIIKFTAV
jgi:ribosomal protein S16